MESGDFSKSQSFYTGQELGIFPSPGASIEVIFHIFSHIFQIFLHIMREDVINMMKYVRICGKYEEICENMWKI